MNTNNISQRMRSFVVTFWVGILGGFTGACPTMGIVHPSPVIACSIFGFVVWVITLSVFWNEATEE